MSYSDRKQRDQNMKNSQHRNREKRDRLLQWVGTFQVSTFSLWCRYEGLVSRGQYAFIQQMKEDRLVSKMPCPLSRETVLMLTPKGKRLAVGINPDLTYAVTHPSRIAQTLIPHTLLVQKLILTYHDKSVDFIAERQLAFANSRKRPDALIYVDGKPTALETELTPKYRLRIYCIFRQHIAMINDKHYDHVLYCFNDPTTMAFYQRLFEEHYWPVVILHRQDRRYRIKYSDAGEPLQFDPGEYRQHFSFRRLPDDTD